MNCKQILYITFFIISTQIKAQTSIPNVVSGKINRIENFQSRYITERNVDIWLPEGYTDTIKYAVLYMHDGQMLYDPDQTWNKQAWDIDSVVTDLLKENKIGNFIVVGIWNDEQTRHQDYFPQKPFEQLTQIEKDTISARLQRAGKIKGIFNPKSDKYLKFITEELKPYIDKKYSVYTNRDNTFIAGSSMGGLISLYAICEYPEIFGGAACLSTHWTGSFTLENNPMPNEFLNYLNKNLPSPNLHKIYFDCGDQTLDSLYPKIQKEVDSIMVKKGYDINSWITRYFPGENHSEQAWNKRLNIPLEFLFKK
ncbi:MAG: alpha/beta hydrolase [Saprospiraceae bacterium]|nr:alpha/beta hydrolase [Saprospiraceae bacterium]